MTLLVIDGLWKHGILLAHAALDENQESATNFQGSNNHVHEDGHTHDDASCDCNAQGELFLENLIPTQILGQVSKKQNFTKIVEWVGGEKNSAKFLLEDWENFD